MLLLLLLLLLLAFSATNDFGAQPAGPGRVFFGLEAES